MEAIEGQSFEPIGAVQTFLLYCRDQRGAAMMDDGWMWWGMGAGHLIGLLLLALVIAALVKYVFFR